MTSETVRLAAASPDLNHREPEYLDLVRETKARLLTVYPELSHGWTPYLLGGSGTAAVEAMVTSLIERGPVLVLENGYYSARIVDILEVHGIPYEVLSCPWDRTEPFHDLSDLALESGHFEAVLMTHHETTLGRLNPVAKVSEVCRAAGMKLLVDAMSSFGADPVPLDGVTAIASSANKCLHGLPGVSFVLVNGELPTVGPRSYYLHLARYAGDAPPLTPPVPTLQAFRQTLREMPEGGALERGSQYRALRDWLEAELVSRGFSFAVPGSESSCSLLCPSLPGGWTFEKWYAANHEAGFALYGCKGAFRERFFQVSVMGEVRREHLDAWLGVVDRLLAAR